MATRLLKWVKYVALIDPPRLAAFRGGVLGWFREAGRDLPWRRTRDPYAILVSEILLHQTTVNVVSPVYERFMDTFPTVADLAAADLTTVKAITDPLGYKVRGRWLKDIAVTVMRDFHGRIPDSLEALLTLPGVGRYTAGAVLSFAYGVPAGVLDTNVARIMSRFFGVAPAIGGAERLHRLWALAEAVVPETDPWTFNQALMDFGALVCTARKPDCLLCPVGEWCPTRGGGQVAAAESLEAVGVVFWERPRARAEKARGTAEGGAAGEAPHVPEHERRTRMRRSRSERLRLTDTQGDRE